MLDVIGLLYAIQIVAKFYKVQYEHMKQDAVGCPFVFVANFLRVYFCQKLAKSDEI